MAAPIPQAIIDQIRHLQGLVNGLPQPFRQVLGPQVALTINQLAQFTIGNNQLNQAQIQQLNVQVHNLTNLLQTAQNNYNAQVAANAQLAAANAGIVQQNQVYVQANAQLTTRINQQANDLGNLTNQINADAARIQQLERDKNNLARASEIRELLRKKIDLLIWGEHEVYKAKCLFICSILAAGSSVEAIIIQKGWQARLSKVKAVRDTFNDLYAKNQSPDDAFKNAKNRHKLTEEELKCEYIMKGGIEKLKV